MPDAAVTDAAIADAAMPTEPARRYVTTNEIYTGEESATYVHVLDTLDVTRIGGEEGVELAGGRATIATLAGWLFISHPEEPVISRFTVSGAGELDDQVQISFAGYGLEAAEIDEWGGTFISAEKAYLFGYRRQRRDLEPDHDGDRR